ncbi:hypothetical protein RHODO2019_10890 [Rhodococcus antarcticus]|uniref:Uncharacterized protein n=1 Tax=Rhodococcus antarcticus TaxID=2987751 RepID=A0ABY6NXK3_9NOCA|nr:hypothetical protein [Rhodococcus antarcticus]UZJ23713.1 hypothetical protein RHODO2019_10890 [Rhodococcus antarcticus]
MLELVENGPVEDILLAVLREGLPDIEVVSLIADAPPPTFILVRRLPGLGDWSGDPRFTDFGRFFVNTFTADPDGDEKGALLSEAARVVLRNAWLAHRSYPGLGSITSIRMAIEPSRRTDWATSSGPVQYADLPTGFWRYDTQYQIKVRRPFHSPLLTPPT